MHAKMLLDWPLSGFPFNLVKKFLESTACLTIHWIKHEIYLLQANDDFKSIYAVKAQHSVSGFEEVNGKTIMTVFV